MKKLITFACLAAVIGVSWSIPSTRNRRESAECIPLASDLAQCSSYWSGRKPPVLIISFDGFRADYLSRMTPDGSQSLSPTLNRLANCGVRASSMIPVFPTSTFPNHYSMVTGLYPESHGIVSNHFYDPQLHMGFSLSSPNATQPYWWLGEPIWHTAAKQGKKSASYFWPGSDVLDRVREPTYWLPYDGTVPFSERIRKVVQWLTLPLGQRPHFLALYLNDPDHTGHNYGPDSLNVDAAIFEVDRLVQSLLDGLERNGILGCINIMVVSDHGMASTSTNDIINLNNYIYGLQSTTRIYDGVFPNIRPNSDTPEENDRIARALECQDWHMRVYNKWELPRRHHYAESERIPPILLDLAINWRASVNHELDLDGNHGWDNLNNEMQTIFVAQGPSFRRGMTVPSFHNIELYNLMCVLLEINPSPNNGTWGALHHMLVSPPAEPASTPLIPPSILYYPPDRETWDHHNDRLHCELLTPWDDPATDFTFDLSEGDTEDALILHSPWGQPQSSHNSDNIKVLVNENRVTGFDVVAGVPSWVSYTLSGTRQTSNLPVWRLDVRLQPDHRSICDRLDNDLEEGFPDNLVLVPLFPLAFTESGLMEEDAQVDTNAIEVSTFFESYWNHFLEELAETVRQDGPINVVVGTSPDDLRPSLFAVVSACYVDVLDLANCPTEQLDVQSFILPTSSRYNIDCTDPDDFLALNLATVKDIENLSGLTLFPTLSFHDKVALLTRTPLSSDLLVSWESYVDSPPTSVTWLPQTFASVASSPRLQSLLSATLLLECLALYYLL